MTANGLASAAAAAMAAAGPMVADEPVSLALPLGDAASIEARRGERADRDAGAAVRAERRAGRPPGALNKRTGVLRDYIVAQYSHPAIVLAQTYSRPVEVLAAELGCTKLEAFGVQVKAAAELLPYIESKMPVGVQIDARATVSLVIHGADQGAPGAVIDADGNEVLGLSAMLQNQGLEP